MTLEESGQLIEDEGDLNDFDDSSGVESAEVGSQVGDDFDSFDKDPRFETEWNRDPNSIYKAFRESEKTLPTLQKEHGEYRDKVSAYESELQELQTQMGSLSQIKELVDFFEGNPDYQKALMSSLAQVAEDQRRAKYGDLPPEVIERIEKGEAAQRRMDEFERQQQVQAQVSVIGEEMKSIDSIASEYNVDYDKGEFLAYCKNNNVPPQLMGAVFSKFAIRQIANSSKRSSAVNTAKKLSTNRSVAISPGQSRVKQQGGLNFRDTIASMLSRG
jgi:chaperonin cofactor prefoldin